MIIIEDVILSDDIKEKYFHCHLDKCKGACCVEGDQGAPLTEEELPILEEIYPKIKPFLSQKGQETIAEKGLYEYYKQDQSYGTMTINQKECVFAIEEQGVWKCGIEKAYYEGVVDFPKPISCHLYPIRITRAGGKDLLNYERWDICRSACSYGNALELPIYKFVKNALVRKYGEDWYAELEKICEQ